MLRRLAAALGAFAAVAFWMVLAAAPAGATLNGPCEANGTFFPSQGADPDSPPGPWPVDATESGTITIPDKGTVNYFGAIAGGGEGEERSHSGNIVAQIPPVLDPIGDAMGWTEVWAWSDDDATAKEWSGVEDYSVPDWVPRGITIVVAGGHSDALYGNCTGSLRLKIPGSPLSSPVTIVVVIAAAGSVLTMISSGVQIGEPA